jgi:alanyl-tRNA synthetase
MVLDLIERRLSESGFSLVVDRALIPSDDESTLFVCSGMQPVKGRFRACDGGRHASLQSCLRMDDLEAVGDGEHLTYFEMVGSFSFAPGEYELAVQLWDAIARELRLPVTHVTVHPERPDHRRMWERCGRRVELDPACVWSDGDVGGHCCEVFCGEVEIGTIVNPMPDLADVGFGWERLHQVLEGRATVFETSLFAQGCSQVVADHLRALERLVENGVHPGNRGREYVCRKLARRFLREWSGGPRVSPALAAILDEESERRHRVLRLGRRLVSNPRWRHMPAEWWWDTHGILPEELGDLRRSG